MSASHKVFVVGAGFAGLVAARELESAGVEVEIFEARDRIGGRAWTDERMGLPLELGATWVHWMQPFVWTEITRYGQTIYPSPDLERAYWMTGGEVREGTESELDAIQLRPQNKIFEGSEEFFPYPHDPLYVLRPEYDGPADVPERMRAADQGSVLDALRDGSFSQEEIDVCDAYWLAAYNGYTATGSPLMVKHWASLSNHRFDLLVEQCLQFKLTNGMQGIYNAIAEDVRGPIHLSTPVTRVEHSDDAATLTLADGSKRNADAVIVTAPIGAMKHLDFAPTLPAAVRSFIEEGTNSTGFKIWVKIRGHHSFIATAPSGNPIATVNSEYFLDDGNTILVGFGPDHTKIDLQDINQVQEILRRWRPDVEVLECDGHDWSADKWSGQTWATIRSGQFTDGWHHFHDTDSRLYFAGADIAKGWNGVVVDGAIETGITTARRVITELRAAAQSITQPA